VAHHDHPIPLYFYRRSGLDEPGDSYAETRFRRAIDLARNWSHNGHNYGLIGCKTRFGSTIRHLFKSAGSNGYFNDPSQPAFSKKQRSFGKLFNMRLTAKTITAELHRLGHEARLESGDGYFYFLGLEPAAWLDKTVKVPKVSSLTLEEWVAEYVRLKKLNEDLLRGKVESQPAPRKATNARSRKRG
jgi:hypothetical protein